MISLDWTLFIQVINFLVLLWILNRFVYRPILQVLEERKSRVKDAEDVVQSMEERSAQQWEAYQRQLQEARIAANAEKERIKVEGLEAERKLLEKARTETSRVVEETRQRIEEEASKARELLRSQSEDLALDLAEKILGRALR